MPESYNLVTTSLHNYKKERDKIAWDEAAYPVQYCVNEKKKRRHSIGLE